MNPSHHLFPALASAIRNRLVEGDDVLLSGIGRLRRAHKPATADTREDGHRVLLPPSNTIRFAAAEDTTASIDPELRAAFRGSLPPGGDMSGDSLEETLFAFSQDLSTNGAVSLEGVGRFTQESGEVTFEADESLLASVNKPFAGLQPIAPRVESAAEEAVEPAEVTITKLVATVEANEEDELVNEAQAVEVELDEPLDVAASETPVEENTDSPPTMLDFLASLGEQEKPDNPEPEAVVVADGMSIPPVAFTTATEEESLEDRIEAGLANAASGVDEPADEAWQYVSGEEDADDDDIDALLAGVWAPVAAAKSDALEPAEPEAIEQDAVEDEAPVAEIAEIEEEAEVVTPVSYGDGSSISASVALPKATPRPIWEPPAERKQSRAAWLMVPAALAVCALAVWVLWPRFFTVGANGEQVVDLGRDTASTDAYYADHAGGTAEDAVPEDLDLSTIESTELQREAGNATVDPTPEPSTDRQEPVATLAPRAAEPPPAAASRPAAPLPPASRIPSGNQLPASLRGPGQVVPASGGATWVLASGNRTSAEELAARYRSQGFLSSVLPGQANGITVYRVAVGQFANADEARNQRSRLPSDAPASTWILNF